MRFQGLLGHLAGPDHQRLFVVEAFEDLLGEIGHRTLGMLTRRWWIGFRGDPPRDFQRGLKDGVGQRPGRFCVAAS